jgi:hypothetical protein
MYYSLPPNGLFSHSRSHNIIVAIASYIGLALEGMIIVTSAPGAKFHNSLRIWYDIDVATCSHVEADVESDLKL